MIRHRLGLIVEGFCEYDSFRSIISKINPSGHYIPISNAQGIGNIIKNTELELVRIIKPFRPEKIVITLDYRDALRAGQVSCCQDLKRMVQEKCDKFLQHQSQHGSLVLPDSIVVVVIDKKYESWLCADYEGLKTNPLISAELITEQYRNVDEEIENPGKWIGEKIREGVDLKSNRTRKLIAQSLRPEVAFENSRSFRKFHKEVL